jgi:hypothetical protein
MSKLDLTEHIEALRKLRDEAPCLGSDVKNCGCERYDAIIDAMEYVKRHIQRIKLFGWNHGENRMDECGCGGYDNDWFCAMDKKNNCLNYEAHQLGICTDDPYSRAECEYCQEESEEE